MPPASLSTLAVINPGPTTAKNSRIRVFQLLRNLMGTFRRHNLKGLNSQRRHRINARRDSGQTKSASKINKWYRKALKHEGHEVTRRNPCAKTFVRLRVLCG